MKASCIQRIALSYMVGFQNYMPTHFVAGKDTGASLKVKVTVQTYAVNWL